MTEEADKSRGDTLVNDIEVPAVRSFFPIKLISTKGILFFMCCLVVLQGMVVSGLLTISVATIERAYGLSSFESGSIHSIYDLAFIFSAIILSLKARKHRAIFMGLGGILISLGCFIFIIPNFLNKFTDLKNTPQQYENYRICKALVPLKPGSCHSVNTINYFLFLLGYLLIGIGSASLHTIGVTYLENHLSKEESGFYLSIFYAFAALGPAIGFLLGKPFLSLPMSKAYAESATVGPGDQGWIGAWWIGYIMCGTLLFIVSIFMGLYPSDLRNKFYYYLRPKKISSVIVKDAPEHDESIEPTRFRDFFIAMKSLSSNIPFVLLCIALNFESYYTNGVSVFLSKIVEIQLQVSPSQASLLSGVLVVAGATLGIGLSGILFKKLTFKRRTFLKITCIVSVISTIGTCLFLIGCPKAKLYNPTNFHEIELDGNCSSGCECNENNFAPVCYMDSLSFLNPCYAGCKASSGRGVNLSFTNCSCIPEKDEELKVGICKSSKCHMKIAFIVIGLLTFFTQFFVYVPQLSIILSYLNGYPKNLGIAFNQAAARIGFILGPVVFGAILDKSCIIWNKNMCGTESNCLDYQNEKMRFLITVTAASFKISSTLFYFFTYLFEKKLTSRRKIATNTIPLRGDFCHSVPNVNDASKNNLLKTPRVSNLPYQSSKSVPDVFKI